MDYECDGHRYQLEKLKLADAKEALSKLQELDYFEGPVNALFRSTTDLEILERKLFGANVQWLNEQGDWIPMSKALTDSHFEGRVGAYTKLMMKQILYNYEDFLDDGSATDPEPETAAE